MPANADLKSALRRDFRRARRDFVAGLSSASRDILEASLADRLQPFLAAAHAPAAYAAEKSEIAARVAFPLAYPRITGRDLVFHRATAVDLMPGHGGILEPPAAAPIVTPDLLLVPLLAVTSDGRRLGQGGGFYDRLLRRLRAAGPVIAIGIAWDIQLTADLPADPWDEPLDHIATPSRLVDCARFR